MLMCQKTVVVINLSVKIKLVIILEVLLISYVAKMFYAGERAGT